MRVAITNATGDAGSVAASCLRRAGFEVFGIDSRRIPRVLASRHLDHYCCIGDSDPVARVDAVRQFIERSRIDVFLPLCTPGAVAAALIRDQVRSACRTCAPDLSALLAAYDKRVCMEQCRSLGIPCAGSLSRDEAAASLRSGQQSVVVKAAIDIGAAMSLHYPSTVEELEAAIATCRQHHGDCLIQERIPGPASAMHMVTVVVAESDRLVGAFTSRKQQHWPLTGGVTASGVSTREQELLDLVLPFFRHVRWRGPAEVELKFDCRDHKFKVIEINPRFPGYLRLPMACGVNLPLIAIHAALGQGCDTGGSLTEYPGGIRYIAPTVLLKAIRDDARARGWRRAVSDGRENAAGSWPVVRSLLADPVPVVTRSIVPKIRCSALSRERLLKWCESQRGRCADGS